jgi:hypothetical protein
MKTISFWSLLLLSLLSFSVLAESEWDASTLTVPQGTEIHVYRSETCQCCHKWMAHLEQHGFTVIDEITQQLQEVKDQLGMPAAMRSCHTAVIGSYLIEGHVPANDIVRLLSEQPQLRGLSVPQMPVGTPGMEMGPRKDAFNVIGFGKAGHYSLFNRYEVNEQQHYFSTVHGD